MVNKMAAIIRHAVRRNRGTMAQQAFGNAISERSETVIGTTAQTKRWEKRRLFAGATVLFGMIGLLAAGCGGSSSKNIRPITNTSSRSNSLGSLYRVTVNVGNNPRRAYDSWIAKTESQRQEDVSYISDAEMPATLNKGMLLFYPGNDTHFISGKDTLIDCDVVFAEGFQDANGHTLGRVVNTEHLFPFQRLLISGNRPVQLILFVRTADNAAHPIQPGEIIFPNVNPPSD